MNVQPIKDIRTGAAISGPPTKGPTTKEAATKGSTIKGSISYKETNYKGINNKQKIALTNTIMMKIFLLLIGMV